MASLKDKVIIVSGGASGIGLATVLKLAQLGARVHAIDLAVKAAADLPSKNVTFHGSVDVSSRASVSEVFGTIRAKEGKGSFYGLVNCAGIAPYSGGYLQTDEEYLATVAVNQHGTYFMTTELLRDFEADEANGTVSDEPGPGPVPEGKGAIVNIGSSASIRGYSTMGAYCASKHAVLGLTRSWAMDYARFGVRINCVAPGGVDTPLARAQWYHEGPRAKHADDGMAPIPLARMGRPDELAETIAFLLSDASSYITGQVIPVNGGYP
jgi:NAD(P)-dependent dehydrogenase (short-subunit alcohol dehydrogenase family)